MNKYLRNIGGSTDFSDNNSWSSTTNGPADTTAPTAADIIILNAASGSATILNINVDSEVGGVTNSGYTGGWSGTGKFTVKQLATGNMVFSHGAIVFDNLELQGFNDKLSQKLFAGNLNVTNLLTLKGIDAVKRLWIRSDTIGTKRTISAGSVVLENVDFQDITFAGSATWSGISVGDAQGNSGTITYTTPVNALWRKSGGTGNWSDPTSWDTGVVPLCHDNVFFDADSILAASKTITADMPRLGKNVDFTGCLNTPALAFSQDSYIFGNPTFISGMSFSASNKNIYLCSRDNINFTCPVFFRNNLNVNTFGATVLFLSNFTNTSQILYLLSGTLNFNGYSVVNPCNMSLSNSAITRSLIMGNGNINLNGSEASGVSWDASVPTNLSITANSSNIIFNPITGTLVHFRGGSLVYNNVKYVGTATNTIMRITGSNTFNQLEADSTAGANTIQLTAGTTQVVQKLVVNSEPTKKVTISSTSATKANLNSSNDNFIRHAILENIAFGGTGNWYYDSSTVTVTSCTGLVAKNFPTFNTAKNTFNETLNKFGGNMTSKY